MKYLYILTLTLLIICDVCYGQAVLFDTLLKRGKAQFKQDLEKPDYNVAINYLEKAVGINPGNAEAYYFLGYAYSRFNSPDAFSIPEMRMPLVLKASAALEKVNKLTPLYKGESVVLDPYSKITSEWGALALCYFANNKRDSAVWAFKEGKKRGGFDEFILSVNRTILNNCSKNSILVPSGDNFTFPLYYLQIIEKLREDVSVIDVSMLNTKWYPRLIERTTQIKFGMAAATLDTVDYAPWADSTISIPVFSTDKKFTWVVKPSYQEKYILRADRIFLSLLIENKFKRDVFFTKGLASDQQLSLNNFLLSYVLLDKLNATNEPPDSNNLFISRVENMVSTFKAVNPNSIDELTPVDCIRSEIFGKLEGARQADWDEKSRGLMRLLKDYLPTNVYPCYSDDIKKWFDYYGLKY